MEQAPSAAAAAGDGQVEPDRRAGVLDALVRDVRGKGNAITAGDVGYRYVLRALAGRAPEIPPQPASPQKKLAS